MATSAATKLPRKRTSATSCKIFTVCSPKGGVGKTTLTRCLLVAGAQAGLNVIGLDFDPQQSLTKWAARREKTRQALPAEAFVSVPIHPFDLSEWRERLAEFSARDLLVIDTPPGVEANLPAVRGLCEAATIVLVPTGTTRDDLDSVLPWMKELLDAKVRASFVLNKVNRRTNSFAKSRTRLIRIGPVCPLIFPRLKKFIHSPITA